MDPPINDPTYIIRTDYANLDVLDLEQLYPTYPQLCTVKMHHGGYFSDTPCREYLNGNITYVDMVNMVDFSSKKVTDIVEELGYDGLSKMFYHYLIPCTSLDYGLCPIDSDSSTFFLSQYVGLYKEISLYIEHGSSVFNRIQASVNMTQLSDFLLNDPKAASNEVDDGYEYDKGDASSDSDFVPNDHEKSYDAEVDMKEFNFSIDKDVEYIGNGTLSEIVVAKDVVIVPEDDLNNDAFDSESEFENPIESAKKKQIKELKQQEETASVVSTFFHLGQQFGTKEEAISYIRLHAIETRRQLWLKKNDKIRIRAVCKGLKQGCEGEDKDWKCDWVVYLSKQPNKETWVVKTCKNQHGCRTSRNIKMCTYDFLASKLTDKIPSNPNMPIKAVKYQLESEHEVEVTKSKAYRALKSAIKTVQGDYELQYSHLRDYLEELRRANPGTTTTVDVQQCDSSSDIRIFRRVYICLGPLKEGFKALGRDLLGLDGAFMKEPASGELLTAVGVDSNNGIYPVAYALVEKEKYDSWLWFLDCLGRDLGLHTRSNFTFISDRQKGLLQAVDRLYPCAEHRYCVKHLHGNMKAKWSGDAYKNHLWKCATSTTVPEFEKNMLALKGFSEPCWIWLNKIAPKHWSKSHFTGRAHSDVLLSNMCEVLNRWLVDARDKPIITCLEFVREYLTKRIVNVINRMSKCQGPLTPVATKILEGNENDAHKLTVFWNGDGKYQVNGPHGEQVVVDISNKVCACQRWELTGIPCKHVVVVLWNMSRVNDESVGLIESWVHRVHWLDTWKNTYTHKINPVNGIDLWRKSDVPTKLLPPIKEATTGRPKKNRKKGVDEKVDLKGKSKFSRQGTINHCGNCKETGHNKRRCPNLSVNTGQ